MAYLLLIFIKCLLVRKFMPSYYALLKSLFSYILFVLLIFNGGLTFAKSLDEKLAKEKAATTSFSVYVTMRDGVRIATDIHLPKSYNKGDKLPVLLYQTIYQRSSRVPVVEKPDITKESDWQSLPKLDHKVSSPVEFQALSQGYVVIKTDVRGTGASFGHRNSPLPPAEIQDSYDMLDWIVAQPWSNGKVGAYGISYTGMTAGMAATVQHSALKAKMLCSLLVSCSPALCVNGVIF